MIFIPLVSLLIFYTFYNRKVKHYNSVKFIVFCYITMCIAAILLHFSGIIENHIDFSIEAILYFSFSMIIVFYGFNSFNDLNLEKIKIQYTLNVKIIEIFLILGGICSLIYFLPFAIEALYGDIQSNRINNHEIQQKLSEYGVLNKIFTTTAVLFPLNIFFSFLRIVSKNRIDLISTLLFISSTSYIAHILAIIGRDGIVYWILTFVLVYLIFILFMSKKTKKTIKTISRIFIIILLIPFIYITTERFSDSEYGNAFEIINYSGQQIKNFNDAYVSDLELNKGSFTIPFFIEKIYGVERNFGGESYRENLEFHYLENEIRFFVFRTYIGDYLTDFGKINTLIILAVFSFFSRKIIKKINNKNKISVSSLILLFVLMKIVLWGIFYFRFFSINQYFILVIIICVFLKLPISKQKNPTFILREDY